MPSSNHPPCRRVYALKPPASGRKSKVSQYLLPAGETAKDLYCAHTLSKRPMGAAPAEGGAKPATHPLFADERVNTFFRRPTWSPDGEGHQEQLCGQAGRGNNALTGLVGLYSCATCSDESQSCVLGLLSVVQRLCSGPSGACPPPYLTTPPNLPPCPSAQARCWSCLPACTSPLPRARS